MDTKSKKTRPWLIWLCFFLAVNILLSLVVIGIFQMRSITNNIDDIKAALRNDVYGMRAFKADMSDRFERLAQAVAAEADADAVSSLESSFEDEGANLLYYAHNLKTGKTVTNAADESIRTKDAFKLPEGYGYYLYYDGQRFIMNGYPLGDYRYDSGYEQDRLKGYKNGTAQGHENLRIYLIVKKDIVANPYAFSSLYRIRQNTENLKWTNIAYAGAFAAGLLLLLISFLKRNVKREFDKSLSRLSGALWLEVKVVLIGLVLQFLFITQHGFGYTSFSYSTSYTFGGKSLPIMIRYNYSSYDSALSYVLIACGFWLMYVFILDLVKNKGSFFTNNSINWFIKRYRSYEIKKPFQKAMLMRIYVFVAIEAMLSLLIAIAAASQAYEAIPFAVLLLLAGIYLIYRYMRRYTKTIHDLGRLMDHTEVVRRGDTTTMLSLSPNSDMYPAAENLNRIQEGINKAVDEKMKSEQLKMELITNVSHDLKTPLTSIISYVDLLSREQGLPEHVNDYIKILSQKSDRLKTLIQDIFDLSKASSGEIDLQLERLDLGKLIQQTLADLDEKLQQSGLQFKINIPEEPIYILADGKKLYRVFLNVFSNVFKYSLQSSRVFVDLTVKQNDVFVEVKNIANYEMSFNSDQIIERFARGDEARSTEGSGLGLAIAKNFTQVCGGSFGIKVDGDLFKVCLAFKVMEG